MLAQELPQGTVWTRPDGGYFLWLELPEAVDATELTMRARLAGVAFVPGAGFFHGDRGRSTARLSFSYPSVDEIRVGVYRLARLVREAVER